MPILGNTISRSAGYCYCQYGVGSDIGLLPIYGVFIGSHAQNAMNWTQRLAVWARRPHDSTGFSHKNSAGRLQRPNLRIPGIYYASVRSQQCGGGDVRRQFELMVVKSSFGAELPSYQNV